MAARQRNAVYRDCAILRAANDMATVVKRNRARLTIRDIRDSDFDHHTGRLHRRGSQRRIARRGRRFIPHGRLRRARRGFILAAIASGDVVRPARRNARLPEVPPLRPVPACRARKAIRTAWQGTPADQASVPVPHPKAAPAIRTAAHIGCRRPRRARGGRSHRLPLSQRHSVRRSGYALRRISRQDRSKSPTVSITATRIVPPSKS